MKICGLFWGFSLCCWSVYYCKLILNILNIFLFVVNEVDKILQTPVNVVQDTQQHHKVQPQNLPNKWVNTQTTKAEKNVTCKMVFQYYKHFKSHCITSNGCLFVFSGHLLLVSVGTVSYRMCFGWENYIQIYNLIYIFLNIFLYFYNTKIKLSHDIIKYLVIFLLFYSILFLTTMLQLSL